jgi:hypothetical protein
MQFNDEDLETKYNELEKISKDMHRIMSRINQPSLLVEMKWVWTDKFQSTISKYQEAFKDNSYVGFIEKS